MMSRSNVGLSPLRAGVVVAVCLSAASVWAGVSEILGDVRQIPVPESVEPGGIPPEEGRFVNFFPEGFTSLPRPISVDIGLSGAADVVPRGVCIESVYLVLDPDDVAVVGRGTIRFDRPIVGVITSQSLLDASNELGSDAVTYPAALDCVGAGAGHCGLEPVDRVAVRTNELDVDLQASGVGDRIRVLTRANPLRCLGQ